MNAYGYVRVSTDRQAEEGASLEVQAERIRLFCDLKGWRLVEVFEEPGASARTMNGRPQLEACLRAVCASRGVLVFYDLSRIARNEADAGAIARRIERADAHFASVTEPFDSTAVGKLMFAMMAAVAAFHSRQQGEKIAAANRRTVEQRGYRTQGAQQIGWRIVKGERVAVPAEQKVLARILRLRERYPADTFDQTAERLNAAGVPTVAMLRRGSPSRWHGRQVNRIVTRELSQKAPAGSAPQ